jgi:hypothetical protein
MEALNQTTCESLRLYEIMERLLNGKFFGDPVNVPRKLIQVLLATNEWRDVFLSMMTRATKADWQQEPVFK